MRKGGGGRGAYLQNTRYIMCTYIKLMAMYSNTCLGHTWLPKCISLTLGCLHQGVLPVKCLLLLNL